MYEGRSLTAWKVDFRSTDPKIRSKANVALTNVLKQGGVPGLVEAMNDRDETIRFVASQILVAMGPEVRTAIPGLVALLRDKKSRDRSGIAMLLSWKGGPDAVPVLIEALADKDPNVRAGAAYGLGHLKGVAKVAVPALTDLLLQDEDRIVRGAAATALSEIGPEAKSAVPALIGALKDEKIRGGAAIALGGIGPDAKAAVPALIGALKDRSIRRDAAGALAGIGPDAKAAVPALTELLSEKDADQFLLIDDQILLVNAATALGNIGPDAQAATKALTGLARSRNPNIREAATAALDKIKGKPDRKVEIKPKVDPGEVEIPSESSAEPPSKPLEAVSLEQFNAAWQADMDVKDEPAREVLAKLAKGLGLTLKDTGGLDDALAQRVTGKASNRSKLSAIEEEKVTATKSGVDSGHGGISSGLRRVLLLFLLLRSSAERGEYRVPTTQVHLRPQPKGGSGFRVGHQNLNPEPLRKHVRTARRNLNLTL